MQRTKKKAESGDISENMIQIGKTTLNICEEDLKKYCMGGLIIY